MDTNGKLWSDQGGMDICGHSISIETGSVEGYPEPTVEIMTSGQIPTLEIDISIKKSIGVASKEFKPVVDCPFRCISDL